ncbi:protein FAR-RED IMPAIRED RESPONSE 1-like [Rhododendron vialii]|uniref:protein FAR-RED IMPAIRED RESPONSE 1-like n=1 Tax=Rhododendron vialii TaxID=182163 RepID=UPI00265E7664|nr:protein FAR-RED IMPAIRED RESPONSE 1-like [Rhododendron vialii]
MVAWVRRVGKDNGIVIVIKKSASLIGGKLPKCIFSCERSGKYRSARNAVEGQSSQKNTVTKKCECPFELRGIPIPPAGVMWGVRVECGIHNHETAEYFDGHEYPSRLTPEEKEIVRDMADNTAPREILNVLKKKNPLNTTCAQSIYNLKYTDNIVELDGLSPTQFVLNQLIQKRYLHEYRTNPYTNEITDIVWVHPQSLDLFVNFPSVLVINATYKTNEYRLPLLEVVGITSTMCTYSLMFAHLTNERIKNLTWALSTLKKWMLGRGALLPSVFVTDRDLALFSAIEACFPSARHILCIWHINQCIIKHCRGVLGPSFNDFNMSWHSLINSTTEASFNQKWNAMCDDYKQHPQLLQYLFNTWLMPYRDRFVAAWINTCMHLGSNSSQRHDLAYYRWYSMPIPIQSIHDHWTKLSMRAPIVNDEGERPDRTYEVIDRLRGMDQSTQEHMIDRIIDMTDPSQSTVRGLAYNTAHRGRPTGREKQSGRRIPSFTEASTSSSRIESGRRGRGEGVHKTQANRDEFSVPSIRTDYIQHLPQAYQHYISHINDVRGDGHCGFRAIAAHIGYGEDRWAQVRRDLINEIEQNMDLYNALYPEIGWADHLIRSLNYFEDSAPDEYWMDAMSMGVVIASAYNLVLHTFDGLPSGCFTHFPLRSPPVPDQ